MTGEEVALCRDDCPWLSSNPPVLGDRPLPALLIDNEDGETNFARARAFDAAVEVMPFLLEDICVAGVDSAFGA